MHLEIFKVLTFGYRDFNSSNVSYRNKPTEDKYLKIKILIAVLFTILKN